MFVYRLDPKTTEKKLKKEFEIYGPVVNVRVVRDEKGISRGYGFVEFEHKSDFKNAYKKAERKRLDDHRVMVDFERGRTERHWIPRKFGGGKGDSRSYPQWLQSELKEIKKLYPELLKHHKERERSREKEKVSQIENNSTGYKNYNVKVESGTLDENVKQEQQFYEDINETYIRKSDHDYISLTKKKERYSKDKGSKDNNELEMGEIIS